jgi:hypothetical protein
MSLCIRVLQRDRISWICVQTHEKEVIQDVNHRIMAAQIVKVNHHKVLLCGAEIYLAKSEFLQLHPGK